MVDTFEKEPLLADHPMAASSIQIKVENHAGAHGKLALNAVISACNLPEIATWRSINGNEGGNSFFSTMHASFDLMRAGFVDNVFLMTGRFDAPTLPAPAYHAWLEFRKEEPPVVVNVANLHARPLYAMRKAAFMKENDCRKIVQEIPLKRLRLKASNYAKLHEGGRFDIRDFTRKTLDLTFERLNDFQKL